MVFGIEASRTSTSSLAKDIFFDFDATRFQSLALRYSSAPLLMKLSRCSVFCRTIVTQLLFSGCQNLRKVFLTMSPGDFRRFLDAKSSKCGQKECPGAAVSRLPERA